MSLLTSGVKHNELSHNLFTRLNRFDKPLLFAMGDYFYITKSTGHTLIYDNQNDENTVFKVTQDTSDVAYGEDEVTLNLGTTNIRDNFIIKGQLISGEADVSDFDILSARMRESHDEAEVIINGDLVVNNTNSEDTNRLFMINQSTRTLRFYYSDGSTIFDVDADEDNEINIYSDLHVIYRSGEDDITRLSVDVSSGNVDIIGAVNITGNTDITGTLDITGALAVSQNISVGGTSSSVEGTIWYDTSSNRLMICISGGSSRVIAYTSDFV
jgi:hypothetical protein